MQGTQQEKHIIINLKLSLLHDEDHIYLGGNAKQFSGWDISHPECSVLVCFYMPDIESQLKKSLYLLHEFFFFFFSKNPDVPTHSIDI